MQQNITKKLNRRTWSVYVFVERVVQEGRSMLRRKRLTQSRSDRYVAGKSETVVYKFLYVDVTKMYKKDGILYIQEWAGKKKQEHRHDMKHVISIQVREHDRSGRVQ